MEKSKRGACVGIPNPDIFFPVVGVDSEGMEILDYESEEADEALILCDICPILKECRTKNWDMPFGIVGGEKPISRGFNELGIRVKKTRPPR